MVELFAARFQPGEGSYESIAKPFGSVSSISVVNRFAFSVGTDSVNCCNFLSSATAGLTIACADAAAAVTSAESATSAPGAIGGFISPPRTSGVVALRDADARRRAGETAAADGPHVRN